MIEDMAQSLLLLLFIFPVLFLPSSSGLPLCANSRSPISISTPLPFCNYNISSCCDATEDLSLSTRFESMDIKNTSCGPFIKSILCAKCDPFASEIFPPRSQSLQTVPLLCNTTAPVNSLSTAAKPFCEQVWEACSNISFKNSPFGSPGRLSERWKSKAEFCESLGGSSGDEAVCFNGTPIALNDNQSSPSPKGVCLERLLNGTFLNIVPHPDGSNRVFLSNQDGKIWLATVPEQDSNEVMDIDFDNPFLDLTDLVFSSSEFGLLGLAFHPEYEANGRFFVSYNCDKSKSPSCSGRCSCNSDLKCDPSKLEREASSQPCQYYSVIAEYSANSSSSSASKATAANPSEIRRIFTMGLPFTSHHGGQILFGPEDGHLYFMMGDGGSNGDPWNFAQNRNAFLGKILRFNVNQMPSEKEVTELGGWGNYSVPQDNPFRGVNGSRPEIWALGFRNPWRCSFDSERPSYFFCADVGQNAYEEVNLVTKGGNYGWRVYEGPSLYNPPSSPGGNTSANSISAVPPVMGYAHAELNNNTESASITGGYVYRSSADPCLYGRYLFADLYAKAMWEGIETPANSGRYNSTKIQFNCAADSPIPCASEDSSKLPDLGVILSFGEDNGRDVYLLSYNGVQRIVRPSRCGYACSKEVAGPRKGSPPPPSAGRRSSSPSAVVVFSVSSILLLGLGL